MDEILRIAVASSDFIEETIEPTCAALTWRALIWEVQECVIRATISASFQMKQFASYFPFLVCSSDNSKPKNNQLMSKNRFHNICLFIQGGRLFFCIVMFFCCRMKGWGIRGAYVYYFCCHFSILSNFYTWIHRTFFFVLSYAYH